MAKKEVTGWITVNGKHIPLFDGESKDDAYKRFMSKQDKGANTKKSDTKKSDAPTKKAKSDEDGLKKFYHPQQGNYIFTPDEYEKNKDLIKQAQAKQKDLKLLKESAESTGLDEDYYVLTPYLNDESDDEEKAESLDAMEYEMLKKVGLSEKDAKLAAKEIVEDGANYDKTVKKYRNKGVTDKNEDLKEKQLAANKSQASNAKSVESKQPAKKAEWESWKAGDEITYTPEKEFDTVGTPKPIKGKVTSVDADHAIVEADGMKYWVDKDNISQFKPNASKTTMQKNAEALGVDYEKAGKKLVAEYNRRMGENTTLSKSSDKYLENKRWLDRSKKAYEEYNSYFAKKNKKGDFDLYPARMASAIEKEYKKSGDLEAAFKKVIKKKNDLTYAQKLAIGKSLGGEIFHENGVMGTTWLYWFDED